MLLQNGPIEPSRIGGSPVPLDLNSLTWRITNDGVMGGLSRSLLEVTDDGLRFYGDLSTENRGGFVSVLGSLPSSITNPAAFSLVVSGDGKRYQLRLRESESSRDVAWRGYFNTQPSKTRVSLMLDEFHPVMRGQPAIGARPLPLTPIRHIGFMLTSRSPGPFEVKIHSLDVIERPTKD